MIAVFLVGKNMIGSEYDVMAYKSIRWTIIRSYDNHVNQPFISGGLGLEIYMKNKE